MDFQFEICTRKYQTLLDKEMEKKEVQEGLIKACDVIDLIIEILRGSKSQKQVKDCLTLGITEGIRFKSKASQQAAGKLKFTQRQASAILEMRLYRLIGLEIDALMKEHETTLKNIAFYQDVLNNYDSMADVIIRDLDRIKKEYGRKRRTAIENAEEIVWEEKKVEEMELYFLMDRFGYAKTIDKATYERNREAADSEFRYGFSCMNTDKICIFTDAGQMHTVKVLDIPFGKFRDKGTPIDNLSNYSSAKEQMIYVGSMEMVKNSQMLFVTRSGMVKRVEGSEFDVVKRTIASTKLADGDALILAGPCDAPDSVVLQSREGYFLKFAKEEVPVQKKAAMGVRGMKLSGQDSLEHAYLLEARMDYSITYKEKTIVLNSKIRMGKRDTKGTKIRV